jgi:hypothetical protein
MAGGAETQPQDHAPSAVGEAGFALSLVASTLGLLIYVYLIGWVVTWVRLAAARLPSEVATSAFDTKQLFGVGLRTAFFMGLIFTAACVLAYLSATRNWDANREDWHALIHEGGIRKAHQPLEDPQERARWKKRRERELARVRARRAESVQAFAGQRLLKRPLKPLQGWATKRRDAAEAVVEAQDPAAAAHELHPSQEAPAAGVAVPAEDRVLRVVAGFNILVISTVTGLAAGRLLDLLPGGWWLGLVLGIVVGLGVWSVLVRLGPLIARPSAHALVWGLVAATALLAAAPLGLLVIGSVAVSTLGRALARRRLPGSFSELLRSPLPWALLSLYTLVGLAYYASPPVSFQRAVVRTATGEERVGGYLSRTSVGLYLVTCTPLADATSTGERVQLIPSGAIRQVTLGGPLAQLDSGERPSLATLGLRALGVNAHVESLVSADTRARRATCAGAPPPHLTGAEESPGLGAGVIVGPGPVSGQAHDGEPPIQASPTPAAIARLARLYQPTLEVSVADRFWPVSVGAVLKDRGSNGRTTCMVRYEAAKVCTQLRNLSELKPQGSAEGDFLRFPAPRKSNPSNQFHAFLGGQYIFPGPDHSWLADPGLLHPWSTAQIYFFFAGPLSQRDWPGNARNPDVPDGLIGLEYWFFYPYNYYPTIISSSLMEEAPIAGEHLNTDLHQGDWEHVTVLVDPKTLAPRWLYMARHADEGAFLPWESPTLSFDGTHPIVQAAYGGHPTYDDHCGARPRGRVFYISSDWVVCGGGRFAFRAASTPLVDLAQTTWACWRGFFGEASGWRRTQKLKALPESDNIIDKALKVVYAPGPRSPLRQGENAKLNGGQSVCEGEQQHRLEEAAAPALRRVPLP